MGLVIPLMPLIPGGSSSGSMAVSRPVLFLFVGASTADPVVCRVPPAVLSGAIKALCVRGRLGAKGVVPAVRGWLRQAFLVCARYPSRLTGGRALMPAILSS